MDRLSAYAQRESESESPEQRKKTEEEAIAHLMEQLKVQKEQNQDKSPSLVAHQNGDASEAHFNAEEASITSSTTIAETPPSEAPETDGGIEKSRGIPKNVKLFEIFHEQVATLVKMQRLSIQDTIGLLVSLANLSL